jgi:dienelactone hydrolase
MTRLFLAAVLLFPVSRTAAFAVEPADLKPLLEKPILVPGTPQDEVQAFCAARVPPMPVCESVAEWEEHANRIRRDVLDKVVLRGAARDWAAAETAVAWFDSIPGGSGYTIKKLRFEAVPGLWVPGLLYVPDAVSGKVPVALHVNGHDANGKAADYKQIRSINLAKRGMLVLNVEWLGMGQLKGEGYGHYRMNQLDLCGTSGLAPFYLLMRRALDVLLAQEHADPSRVAVSGLSGGGWQTIFISSLDTRVTAANPVAGYSSFLTRITNHSDLGDSEQTPCDLATVADYCHLTALLAPRPALLTYNAKDQCCFASGHALEPLMLAAGPVYELYGKRDRLRSHVNEDPGTHNFEKDNRQQLYRLVGDFFYVEQDGFSADELPTDGEVKTADELAVPLPEANANFNTLARALAAHLPRQPSLPTALPEAISWKEARRVKLQDVCKLPRLDLTARQVETENGPQCEVRRWEFALGSDWHVPAVEFSPRDPMGTVILLADQGRASLAEAVAAALSEGRRALAIDPFYVGESKIASKDHLFALLVSAVGERPIGIQAGQIAAIARSAKAHGQQGRVWVEAYGPRLGMAALVASAMTPDAIDQVRLSGALSSLHQVIDENRSVDKDPELFCFGLLEEFDVKQLIALAAPRPVLFDSPDDRTRHELADLKGWYALWDVNFSPIGGEP